MYDADTQRQVAAFLEEWTPLRPELPSGVTVRCRIGRVKREAKVWGSQPIPVSGEDALRVAGEVIRKLNTERTRSTVSVFVEIMPYGGTKPLDCMDPPLLLGPVNTEDDEGDDATPIDPSKMLGHAMTTLTSMVDIQERSHGRNMDLLCRTHDNERAAMVSRLNHVETMLQTEVNERVKLALLLVEKERRIAVLEATGGEGSGVNAEMLGALANAMPGMQAGLNELMLAAAAKLNNAGRPAPKEEEKDPPPEEAAVNLVQGCAALFGTRPDLLTVEYRAVFKHLSEVGL